MTEMSSTPAPQGTSICLVTRDKPTILMETVRSLQTYLAQPYEVIVVDNDSTAPDTLNILDQLEGGGWQVVRNRQNMGLSRATNQGLALGRYDCLIHLDDDAVVRTPGWNRLMRDYLAHPKVGLVVPFGGTESIGHGAYREIRWGLGFIWAMRRTLFEDIGGYDPQLIHQNECDLGLRVRMAGFHVAGIQDFEPFHNDPGGPRSLHALAREHLGVVQFRDKWASYFRGRGWGYGTTPLYLMQHWPPDQDWYRRFAEAHGVELNPPAPEGIDTSPGSVLGLTGETVQRVLARRLEIAEGHYMAYVDLRNDYSYWERGDGYLEDRQRAIDKWFDLTLERYDGYRWPNLLRPQD